MEWSPYYVPTTWALRMQELVTDKKLRLQARRGRQQRR